jgi:hypothetical protein
MKTELSSEEDYENVKGMRQFLEESGLLTCFEGAADAYVALVEHREKTGDESLSTVVAALFQYMYEKGPAEYREMLREGLAQFFGITPYIRLADGEIYYKFSECLHKLDVKLDQGDWEFMREKGFIRRMSIDEGRLI